MKTIFYQNRTISHLHTDEMNALSTLAPFWGLTFDKRHLTVAPGLSSRTACIKNVHEQEREFLNDILVHSGIRFVENDSGCELLCQIHTAEKQSNPTILTVGNIKYQLKPADNVNQNLQKMIHRNIWLLARASPITMTFQKDMTLKERCETIAYLLIQFFLRDEMVSISHLSFELYAALIEKVLYPINPSLATLQEQNQQNVWPEIPPEIRHNDPNPANPIAAKKQRASTFNPFKKQAPPPPKTVNPFQKNEHTTSNPIHPFKRKT